MAEIIAAFLVGLVTGAFGKRFLERKVVIRIDGEPCFDARIPLVPPSDGPRFYARPVR